MSAVDPRIAAAIVLLVEAGYTVSKNAVAKPAAAQPMPAPPTQAQGAMTVPQFCQIHNISRTHLYALINLGKGPRLMKLGRRTLITPEAAAEWRSNSEKE